MSIAKTFVEEKLSTGRYRYVIRQHGVETEFHADYPLSEEEIRDIANSIPFEFLINMQGFPITIQ